MAKKYFCDQCQKEIITDKGYYEISFYRHGGKHFDTEHTLYCTKCFAKHWRKGKKSKTKS